MRFDSVTEPGIKILVDSFYEKVRVDSALGPIFNTAIQDWPHHLGIMYNFWSSVMLTSGKYKGNPMIKHKMLPSFDAALFDRWLELFDETTVEVFDAPVAAEFQIKARRVAESLKYALYYRPEDEIRVRVAR